MPSILIIDRNSTIKSTNVKTFSDDELYKKAGFKNKDGFAKHAQWTISVKNEPHTIDLYGKTAGRAGQENKYEFPPPADNTLFFGSCIIVCRKNDEVIDISPKEWEKVYEFLYGGFEDIAKGDSETDDDDSDEDDNVPRTKQGYVKDGFIVDDDDAEDDDYSQSSESANERVSAKTKKPAAAKSPKTPKKTNAKSSAKTPKKSKSADSAATAAASVQPENIQFVLSDEPNEPVYLSCTDELVEETYI
jgi:hypothetical protein